jgi:DNA-binding NarL/FixJ family response regulator
MTTHRIVLLDGHRSFLESFGMALTQEPGLSVVGQATSARQALQLVEATRPALLVSELLVHDTDGASVARELTRRKLPTRLMVLSAHCHRAFVVEALRAGVSGYALKEQPLSEIVGAIRAVSDGAGYLAPTLGTLPEHETAQPGGMLERLSRREREVFCRILDGLANNEIAKALSISAKTVETHRAHINRKLGVHSPAELIRVAALEGLLSSGSATRLTPLSMAQTPS